MSANAFKKRTFDSWGFERPLRRSKASVNAPTLIRAPAYSAFSPSVATDGEKAEYAGALIKVGALTEALDLLNGLSNPQESKVLFLKALALISQWNYSD